MNMAWFTTLLMVSFLCGVSWAQYLGPALSYTLVPTQSMQPPMENISCRAAIEELGALLQLLKSLEDDGNSNYRLSEDIIMKLVNALVYTATYNCVGDGYFPDEFHNFNGGALVGLEGIVGLAEVVGSAEVAGAAGVGGAAGVAGVATSAEAAGVVGVVGDALHSMV